MKSPMRRCLPTTTPTRLARGSDRVDATAPGRRVAAAVRDGRGRAKQRPATPPPSAPDARSTRRRAQHPPAQRREPPHAAADAAEAAERPAARPMPPQRPTPTAAADAAADQTAEPVEARRLEQHFVYNSLNAIASLIRTDPARARELLVGFADLSRATDRPTDTPSTLGHELAIVRDYLALEQARFGKRLRVEIDVATGAARPSPSSPCASSPPCATPCSATSNPALRAVCSP